MTLPPPPPFIIPPSLIIPPPPQVYRIRAPGRLSTELSDAIQDLSVGEIYKGGRVLPTMSEGIVSLMSLWARRSMLLCTLGEWGCG